MQSSCGTCTKPGIVHEKAISSARTSISFWYHIDDCEVCNHVTHNITHKMLVDWSDPHELIHSVIAVKVRQSAFNKRIVLVYTTLKATG